MDQKYLAVLHVYLKVRKTLRHRAMQPFLSSPHKAWKLAVTSGIGIATGGRCSSSFV
jgi:hypothetical protein